MAGLCAQVTAQEAVTTGLLAGHVLLDDFSCMSLITKRWSDSELCLSSEIGSAAKGMEVVVMAVECMCQQLFQPHCVHAYLVLYRQRQRQLLMNALRTGRTLQSRCGRMTVRLRTAECSVPGQPCTAHQIRLSAHVQAECRGRIFAETRAVLIQQAACLIQMHLCLTSHTVEQIAASTKQP